MAKIDLVKQQLQNLVNLANETTGNNNTSLTDGVNALVEGYGQGGVDTNDATVTPEKMFLNETAYAKGQKVTGTFTIDNELNTQDGLISQIQTALQNKASASAVLQAKTVTPTTSSQNITPDSGYDGLSKVTVNAIPSTYVQPSTTKAATTYTPSTSNQTIAAGTYCSGVQTIKGDVNLKAENIAEGVSIFGITGTHSAGGSGGGNESTSGTISVTVNNNSMNAVYYWDSNKELQSISGASTVEALNGVLFYKQEVSTTCTGNYLRGMTMGFLVAIFLSDGGTMTCYGG